MRETPFDLDTCLADLRRVPVADLPALSGDSVLERTIARLQREAEDPGEAISSFASAI